MNKGRKTPASHFSLFVVRFEINNMHILGIHPTFVDGAIYGNQKVLHTLTLVTNPAVFLKGQHLETVTQAFSSCCNAGFV